jgi:LytR cell envelope-related transcriptional attenuator
MSVSLLAFSVSSTFTKIGAVVAFAALLGIAVLALLVFSQAREIRRLREWAGRAPERAADMEQRVSAAAAARVQGGAVAPQSVRPVPRAQPIHARPAAAGAAVPAGQAVSASGAPAASIPPPAGAAAAAPGTPSASPGQVPSGAKGATEQGQGPQPIPWQQPAAPRPAQPAPPVGAPASVAGAQRTQAQPAEQNGAPPAATPPAPATAAAAAASAAGAASRATAAPAAGVPPTPSPPAPSAAQPAAGRPVGTAPAAPRSPGPPPAPPVQAGAASTQPGAASAQSGGAVLAADRQRPPLPPAPPAPRRATAAGAAAGAPAASRVAAEVPGRSRGSRLESRGGSRRRVVLVAIAIAVAVALVLVLVTKGGSSGPKAGSVASHKTPAVTSTTAKHHHATSTPKQAKATPPAETSVVVLNGTETTGLASRLSSQLQQSGYSQAAAKFGRPPGANEVTVVEYATGHQPDAAQVARSLAVSHVEPMEQGVSALAGSAKVAVVVGADKATAGP